MEFGLATYGLSLLAGVLSTLSPCVLPLTPILIGSALLAHRLGPFALTLGLTLSFTFIGVLVASFGASAELDQESLRNVAAYLLLAFGLLLSIPILYEKFSALVSRFSSSGQTLLSGLTLDGLSGQFILGMLLGLVWSPCVGPTLGAAITLASQGKNLSQITLVMAIFGLGASLPLIALGLASRSAMSVLRGNLLVVGKIGKQLMGGLILLMGVVILTGWDKQIEIVLLKAAPDWLVRLTTYF